ncbi:3-dehydroquinate synthase [Brachybacterium sp. DNPG3]
MSTPEALATTVIPVGTPTGSYDVLVGRGLLGRIAEHVPERARRVVVVHQPTLRDIAEQLREAIAESGRQAFLAEVPDGEEAKTAQVAGFLWQVCGQAEISRTDLVIGLGGGAATDLAGFVAASWLRGIDVLQVPTTVAAMVDAAVGGKTGINTAEGKNLVGAFHTPIAVIEDLDVLAGLGANDVAAGLAEVVKGGFIADERILEIVEEDPSAVLDTSSAAFREVVERKIRIKARVVSNDLKESGEREILNYGHTLGHAIERNERFQWRHGAAVAVGMVFAAELSHLAGKLSEEEVDRHRSILTSLGLPTTYRGRQWPKLEDAMKRDKKTRAGLLRFVVLDRIGKPSRLEGPDPALLLAAYSAIAADD